MKKEGYGILAAVASRTDEPSWAFKCMDWLTVHDGSTLTSCFDHVEISFAAKEHHFRSLHKQTGIPYERMCFFDNEEWNILSVAPLGVKCIHTPDGMTRDDWKKALSMFDMP
jgi:magnesium-dependent phosphatase 1